MTQAYGLIYYDIRRLVRRRPLALVLIGLPIACALLRVLFPDSILFLRAAWTCPFVCLTITCAAVVFQHSLDAACGVLAGMRAAPMSNALLIGSRSAAGALLYLVQMAVFFALLSLRF